MMSCRCAEAFAASGRHDAAVRLLVKGKQVDRALDLLLTSEVPLTEELAEALTPPKTADNTDQRNAVLLRLAQVGSEQQRMQDASRSAVCTNRFPQQRHNGVSSPVMLPHLHAGCQGAGAVPPGLQKVHPGR